MGVGNIIPAETEIYFRTLRIATSVGIVEITNIKIN
jgi:hypothetical protein